MEFLKIEDLCKEYGTGNNKVIALDHVSLTIEKGDFTAITGTSGSGKSTLLHAIAGVDVPTSGKIYLDALKKLRDLGNTVLVVEHDEDTMYAADQIIDIGPRSRCTRRECNSSRNRRRSKTSARFSNRRLFEPEEKELVYLKREENQTGKTIEIIGAEQNNLKNINVKIPLGVFTCITGVSGSVKSTLVNEILYKNVAKEINKSNEIKTNK